MEPLQILKKKHHQFFTGKWEAFQQKWREQQ
jgi:hypothetical protein